jgi:hypothetical protein
LLAAEFVLGTLDSEERSGAHSLLKTDHGFIAMVRIWERRFGELHLMVEPVDPDAQLWQRIKSKVAGEAPATPAAEGEPPANQSPAEAAAPAAAPEPPKPAEGAVAEEAKPPETQASEAAPPPAEAAAEAAKSAEAPPTPSGLPPAPDLVVPPAVDIPPSPDPRALEAIVKSAPVANGAVPGPPPPLTPPFPQLVERPPEEALDRPNRQREFTIDVIRSRGRWRAFGMAMTVVLAALAGLVAAWKFVPDQLPAGLRPAELMMSIGVEAAPNAAPARKRAPLESGFDE